MASSSSSTSEKYPYPSDINPAQFVLIKLSKNNYFLWRKLMLDFIVRQRLVGFIDGTIPPPPKRVTVPDDSSSTNGTKEIENKDYESWEESDALVQRWIRAMVNEELLLGLVVSRTANQIWATLEKFFSVPFMDTPDIALLNDELAREAGKHLSKYLPLHKAALEGDWETANEIFGQEPDAIRVPITTFSETALHIAVRSKRRNHFVKKLVELMSPEDLALGTAFTGLTALQVAAKAGNIDAAKLLVNKNPLLPYVGDNSNTLPLHRAAKSGHREMVMYLFRVTKRDIEPKLYEDERGVKLVHALITGGLYDVALTLIQDHPMLASATPCPLEPLTMVSSAFPSGTHLNFWQRWIYSYVPLKLENIASHTNGGDIENPTNCFIPVRQKLSAICWEVAEIFVPQIKHVRQKKLIHHHALQLVQCLCEEVGKLDHWRASSIVELPLRNAVHLGIHEVVEEIFCSLPGAIYYHSVLGQSVFHRAIEIRCENVFNLIYQFDGNRDVFLSLPDTARNNALHLAGYLSPQQLLNLRGSAAGAALQMQREVQWFKEVEKLVPSTDKEQRNCEGKTAAEIFSETHKDLVKEGEKWMKDTANSCTIIASLIATVVFAAAITVPGGSNNDNGIPIFAKEKAFVIFAISDALALFSSLSSVLMFLSILTSRYGEHDFLYALPKRLIIGLVTLFLSILSMMIAFGTTLYLVFGVKKPWILVPVVGLACLPVTLFAFLQFPLLLDMIKSTYGPGIFRKQSDRTLF